MYVAVYCPHTPLLVEGSGSLGVVTTLREVLIFLTNWL